MKLATMLKIITAAALTLAVLPAMSLAQTITAMGTVTDANGHPVSGADVTLIDDSLNALGVARTDADGSFCFSNVSLSGSTIVKALVTYVHNGQNFNTRPENINWIDASQGLVSIPVSDTRLYNYPLSDRGYVWGTVIESLANSRALSATVYLEGKDVRLSAQTGDNGAFEIQVPPGKYQIYAALGASGNRIFSNLTEITVQPSNSVFDSAPIVLIADQKPASIRDSIKPVPFALALAFGALMIIAGRALLNRK